MPNGQLVETLTLAATGLLPAFRVPEENSGETN